MYENVGPRPVELDGQVVLLQSLSPEGHSAIVDYIRRTKKPESTLEKVCEQMSALRERFPDLLTPEHVQKCLDSGIAKDHEERMRERFAPPSLPTSAFFDADVCELMLCLMATPATPGFTSERAKEIVTKLGVFVVNAKIGLAFPGDTEKKDLERLQGLFGGAETKESPTGAKSVTNSASEPTTIGSPTS